VRGPSIAVANLRCDARSSWCQRENAVLGERISETSIASLAGELFEEQAMSDGGLWRTVIPLPRLNVQKLYPKSKLSWIPGGRDQTDAVGRRSTSLTERERVRTHDRRPRRELRRVADWNQERLRDALSALISYECRRYIVL
jgi:hypothetical protein